MPAIVPLALFVAVGVAPLVRRLTPVVGAVALGAFLAYVFGEDDYRGNGISRWDAYRSPGGGLEPLFWVSRSSRSSSPPRPRCSAAGGSLRSPAPSRRSPESRPSSDLRRTDVWQAALLG